MTPSVLHTYDRSSLRRRSRRRLLRSFLALGSLALVTAAALAVALGVPGDPPADRLTEAAPEAPAEGAEESRAGDAEGESPRPEPTPVALPASAAETLTVAAVGDMIFDRKVAELIAAHGGEAPLARVAPLLAEADIAVGNLESPLSDGGRPKADKDVLFRGDPRGVQGLRLAGFDFLSLANNHALDYGPSALDDTLAALDESGIGYAGAGAEISAAWKAATAERKGSTVAFLSFSHILPAGFVASESRAGIAQGRGRMEDVAEAIRTAKREHDHVIVSFHWGVEYSDHANGDQVRDAHAAIDAGADMVLSHHPHVIQGVERYRGGLIAYSLGDFVFDHYSRKTGEAFVLQAELGPHGVGEVRFVPVYLDDRYGRPEVVSGRAASVILTRLREISAPLGGRVSIEGDIARLEG